MLIKLIFKTTFFLHFFFFFSFYIFFKPLDSNPQYIKEATRNVSHLGRQLMTKQKLNSINFPVLLRCLVLCLMVKMSGI